MTQSRSELRPAFRSALVCALVLPCALAALPAFAKELPKPRVLMDRHLAAVGGIEAAAKSLHGSSKIRLEIVENGMTGAIQVYGAENRMVMRMEMAGMQVSTGIVDGVSWSIDPMHGPRLLDVEEAESMLHDLSPEVALFEDEAIKNMRTVALADSEGRPCYRVDIEWKDGRSSKSCFDPDSGLLLSTEGVQSSPMGELNVLMHFYDYAANNGFKQPMKMRMKMAGITQVMTVESIDSAPPPAEVFALPPAIAALVRKAEAAKIDKPGSTTSDAARPQAVDAAGEGAAKPQAAPAKPAAGGR